jgi:hypothetical protein
MDRVNRSSGDHPPFVKQDGAPGIEREYFALV